YLSPHSFSSTAPPPTASSPLSLHDALPILAKRLGLSSILGGVLLLAAGSAGAGGSASSAGATARAFAIRVVVPGQSGAQAGLVSDRKSTRLNSSHRTISYAVFCLKKKKKQI